MTDEDRLSEIEHYWFGRDPCCHLCGDLHGRCSCVEPKQVDWLIAEVSRLRALLPKGTP